MSEHDPQRDEPGEKPLIDDDLKKNVKSRNTWLRLFYILVFAVVICIAEFILVAVVIVQFFTVLLSGKKNEKLLAFGADMSLYVYDIWRYLCFVSEWQPFPFGDWRAAPDTQNEESD